jgi:hypothetical protein
MAHATADPLTSATVMLTRSFPRFTCNQRRAFACQAFADTASVLAPIAVNISARSASRGARSRLVARRITTPGRAGSSTAVSGAAVSRRSRRGSNSFAAGRRGFFGSLTPSMYAARECPRRPSRLGGCAPIWHTYPSVRFTAGVADAGLASHPRDGLADPENYEEQQ